MVAGNKYAFSREIQKNSIKDDKHIVDAQGMGVVGSVPKYKTQMGMVRHKF